MASLVTLSAAPYNPYNTSFANIALEGLRMAQTEMARRDQNAQSQFENYQRSVEFGANVLFKQQEMALNRKKFDFSVDQALFERKLAVEEADFKKKQFTEGVRQFDISSGQRGEEIGIRRDALKFDVDRWTDPVASQTRDLTLETQRLQNEVTKDTLNERQETRPLRELGQRVQIATQLSNSQANLINAETNATNAENRSRYYEEREKYDREKAAQVRAVNGRIDDTRNAISRAMSELARAQGKKSTFDRMNNKKSAEEVQIEANIQKLHEDLSNLNRQLSNIQGDNGMGGGYTPPVSDEENFLRSPSSMGAPNALLPSVSPTPELD